MANSKFSYVRSFEEDDRLPPENWIVVSLKNVSKLVPKYYLSSSQSRKNYYELLSASARQVLLHYRDIKLSYCHFDTAHFVFIKNTSLYKRRTYKLLPYIASCLSASFISSWPAFFGHQSCSPDVSEFEGRVYLFPSDQTLRDYLTSNQIKHHNTNLLHTLCLAHLEQDKFSLDSKKVMSLSDSSVLLDSLFVDFTGKPEKYFNETLFTKFSVNYNNESEEFKKGSILRNESALHPDLRKNVFWESVFGSQNITSYNNKLSYVKHFELKDKILNHCWTVIRIDGKGFHEFSKKHDFDKPNDLRAINLMNAAAAYVMEQNPDIVLAFGESDEFSFLLDRYGRTFERRCPLLVSKIVSQFTSAYINKWPEFLSDTSPLKCRPMFDGRAVMYPTNSCLRDYYSWRQADCHINNMYNTVFWKLVQQRHLSPDQATKHLEGTFSKDKRKILLELGVDYDEEPAIHRKGSVLYRNKKKTPNGIFEKSEEVLVIHEDIISDEFWLNNPHILGSEKDTLIPVLDND